MTKKTRAHALISGRVQGVCFRYETKRKAEEFDICGWVKNRGDGRVEAIFEGEKDRVDAIIKWCHKGPDASIVDEVDVTFEDSVKGENEFRITF